MGIFHELVTIVNRAPIPLSVRFDGQDINIPVGESPLPAVAVNYAKNQNTIMGSQDPQNPSLSGARYLVGVKGTRDAVAPLTKDEWKAHCDAASRLDLVDLYQDVLLPNERVEVRGKGKPTQARGRQDKGVAAPVMAEIAND